MSQKKIRLSDSEIQSIISATTSVLRLKGFEPKEISIFGSRTSLEKKGGDIDLYILLKNTSKKNRTEQNINGLKRELRISLEDRLGEQKIDIILDDGVCELGSFKEVIRSTKVILWTKNTSSNFSKNN